MLLKELEEFPYMKAHAFLVNDVLNTEIPVKGAVPPAWDARSRWDECTSYWRGSCWLTEGCGQGWGLGGFSAVRCAVPAGMGLFSYVSA